MLVGSTAQTTAVQLTETPIAHAEAAPVPLVEQVDPLASNCYLYLKSLIPNLPRTSDMVPNSITPVVNQTVILSYGDVIHYAYITAVETEGIRIKESNFGGPGYTSRFLEWSYLESHSARYFRVEPDNSG